MVRSIIVATAAAAFLGSAVQAQQAAPQSVKRTDLIAKLDSGFAALDTNHDGTLSVAELQAGQNRELQQLEARRKAEIEARFKQLDTNHDGQLSLAEFSAAIPDVKAAETAQQVFQKLDTNHDGKVTAAEFKAARLQAFDQVDANHDGVVTPAEIEAYAKAHPSR